MTLSALEAGDLRLVLPVSLIERPKAVLNAVAELGPRHNEGDDFAPAGEVEPNPIAFKRDAGGLIDVIDSVASHVPCTPAAKCDTLVNAVNGAGKIFAVNERFSALASKAA